MITKKKTQKETQKETQKMKDILKKTLIYENQLVKTAFEN
jgi:hypothetical protein